MKLKSFQISSYRSCLKSKINFSQGLTALIGVNGSGKTNLLNGVLLLKKMCENNRMLRRDLKRFNKCRIQVEIEVNKKIIVMQGKIFFETDEQNRDDVKGSKIHWDLSQVLGDQSLIKDFPIEMFSSNSYVLDEFLFQKKLEMMDDEKSEEAKKNILLYKKTRAILQKVTKFFENISYYSATRFADPSRCPVSIELEEGRPLRRMRSENNHEKFIKDLYASYKIQDAGYKRYLNTINSNGISLVEEISFNEVEMPSNSYEVKSGGKIEKIERKRVLVVPSFTVDKATLSPNQLSEGTFKTLALLFYLLTDESDLLLVEEPEVCIHHGLLDSLISLIKIQSKRKQIIISTHSDFVLDQLSPENLILVKKEKVNGTIASALSKTMKKNDYEALKDYLKDTGNLGEYWREGGIE